MTAQPSSRQYDVITFDAGFLAGRLRGLPLDRCLEIACQCGRSVANAVGGLQGQLTWEVLSQGIGIGTS